MPSITSIPAEQEAVWSQVSPAYNGVQLNPVAYLGSQVVNGTNYQFLCIGNPETEGGKEDLYVAVVYQDFAGNTTITGLTAFDLEALDAETDAQTSQQVLPGGWSFASEATSGAMEQAAATAISGMLMEMPGRNIAPIMVLGVKEDTVTRYAILCYETTEGQEGNGFFEVAFLDTEEFGTYLSGKLVPLNLADYNN